MSGQVDYYDRFGQEFAASILDCPEPELWTTDYREKGRVYREMKLRLETQQHFIEKYFSKMEPVLDVGCGFGRQASWLAKQGYRVTGIDSSPVFVGLARSLFSRNNFQGEFLVADLAEFIPAQSFDQVLLLDVIEHLPPGKRKTILSRIATWTGRNGILILSLPHVKRRFSSYVNNRFVRPLTSAIPIFRKKQEHPYRIPVKRELIRLFTEHFMLIEYQESTATDYYIFQKQ
jgi:2-polyprenyl-3-methyl-5-hydroxy-6-metoxy-1,4-benzoquinol methylase